MTFYIFSCRCKKLGITLETETGMSSSLCQQDPLCVSEQHQNTPITSILGLSLIVLMFRFAQSLFVLPGYKEKGWVRLQGFDSSSQGGMQLLCPRECLRSLQSRKWTGAPGCTSSPGFLLESQVKADSHKSCPLPLWLGLIFL